MIFVFFFILSSLIFFHSRRRRPKSGHQWTLTLNWGGEMKMGRRRRGGSLWMKGVRGAVGFTEQGSHSVQALGGSAAFGLTGV